MAGGPTPIVRDDNLLGACYAVGEAFGFNPLWLRILFAFAILSSPAIALTAYAALTAIVVLSRWIRLGGASGGLHQGIGAPR